ncbi:MAG: di-heme oxidoredictase family protein [Vicinamibacterales bacterium]
MTPARRAVRHLAWLLPVVIFAVAFATRAQERPAGAGGPLVGLTPREFSEFRMGLDDFLEVETAEEGLGPAFNGTSCAVCHNIPAIGGGGLILEVRAGYRDETGAFKTFDPTGETLMHLFSTPSHGCQPGIPDQATVIARRAPIPLFGAGLVEAISDETIIALEDPLDRDGDGVSGRAAIITDVDTGDRRVGRFGWKAQHATLITFGADAYRNEMGITNDLFPIEVAFGISPERIKLCDPFPDPEDRLDPGTRRRGIDNFASFMKFLAPLPRAEASDGAFEGERIFHEIGCATCHVPTLMTGVSASRVFDRKQVPLFSDLLLHDIGTGDGIPQGAATEHEIRTPALWGLRFRRPLLHDGSATTIDEAIARHANEAGRAQRLFARLDPASRAALVAFLKSL